MASPEYVLGELHAAHEPLSSLHSKLELLSLELKTKVAVVAVVIPAGPLPIVVWGAVVSTGADFGVGAGDVGDEVGELLGLVAGGLLRSKWMRERLTRTARPTEALRSLLGLLARSSMPTRGLLAIAKVALMASRPMATETTQAILKPEFS